MFWEIIKIALQSLRDHKFRSLLTVLSVTIGAFSITVMLSLAESGQATLTRSVEAVGGARLVWWVPDPSEDARDLSLYPKGLVREDLRVLQTLPGVERASGMASMGQQTIYRVANETQKADVVGVLPGYLEGLTWKMQAGRGLLEEEYDRFDRSVILTDGLAKKLFGSETAVGTLLSVMGKPYQVVGVLERRKMMGLMMGFDWDNSAFVPAATLEKREGMVTGGLILVAFTKSPEVNVDAMTMGNARLLARHNGVSDFMSINFGEVLESFYTFFLAFRAVVAAIAAVSLFAGGIGVMNIMLVSVTERTREIGIRKAMGASIPTVLLQFLGEATVLSCVGGLFGVGLGLASLAIAHPIIGKWSDFWVSIYSGTSVLLALGSCVVIGLFFGAWPALQASRLDIVECLRR